MNLMLLLAFGENCCRKPRMAIARHGSHSGALLPVRNRVPLAQNWRFLPIFVPRSCNAEIFRMGPSTDRRSNRIAAPGCRLLGMAQRNKRTNSVRLNRCPEYNYPQALMEHGIAAIVRVGRSDDLAVALKASQWLVEYAESLLNGERQAKEETASTVSPNGSPPWRVC